jgi:hypothetical protein
MLTRIQPKQVNRGLRTDNVRFHKEKFYSPCQQQTYLTVLPTDYVGEFGPDIRSLVVTLYYGSEMAEPKIAALLQNIGVHISDGQISKLLPVLLRRYLKMVRFSTVCST